MGSLKKRSAWALLLSVSLHVAVLWVMKTPNPSARVPSSNVELEITESRTAHPEAGQEPIPPPVSPTAPAVQRESSRVFTPRRSSVAHDGKEGLTDMGGVPEGAKPGSGAEGVANATDAPEAAEAPQAGGAPQKHLLRSLSFSDFERIMGESAEQDREDYRRRSDSARKKRGAFVSASKRARKALMAHRSFTAGNMTLALGESKPIAADYLKSIHRKLSPHFSGFLHSLDSPYDRMHETMQSGPFKYNPL